MEKDQKSLDAEVEVIDEGRVRESPGLRLKSNIIFMVQGFDFSFL